MLFNTSVFAPNDDDANYDENDAVWQEDETGIKDELNNYGFKAVDEEVEEVEEKDKKTDKDEDDDDDDEDKKDDGVIEGFGLEKDV